MDQESQIISNLERIQSHIRSVCSEKPPHLLAVSKRQANWKVRALSRYHQDFAENYLQELEEKATDLDSLNLNWHFIGQLQSNKISRIVKLCCSVHTLTSEKHARYLERAVSTEQKAPFPVFIEVNLGAEHAKGGINLEAAPDFAAEIINSMPSLKVMGLMAIPPRQYNDKSHREPPQVYLDLAKTARKIGEGQLSLGMSQDLTIAIKAGSNYVRVGTDLFGPRET